MISGSSAKITLTAGFVRGLSYGGNTAMGTSPRGTSAKAPTLAPEAAEGDSPPPPPPPPNPGVALPKIPFD